MTSASERPDTLSETEVADRLQSFTGSDSPIATTLRTDDRVIARVTDGIYRQPGSALRELISNAYDADATLVNIQTDRPRFSRIIVEDNGSGMSAQTVAHLLFHIGGSAKRTQEGVRLGVTNPQDPSLSPGGRPLIGKIGIGLFSVAQLTQSFQLITKVRGEKYRTVAKIVLRQFSETSRGSSNEEYEAGKVLIWREPAMDETSHGTTIILDSVRPQTRDTLRSTDVWESAGILDSPQEARAGFAVPKYHIGVVQKEDENRLESEKFPANLPWKDDDSPRKAYIALVDAIGLEGKSVGSNPRLDKLLDYYLRMVWDLSLWIPLPYFESHPFDLPIDNSKIFYGLPQSGVNAQKLEVADQSVREALQLGDDISAPQDFEVVVDDLSLLRPIRFNNLPRTSSALQTPIFFAGKYHQSFNGVDVNLSGGTFSFQYYLMWSPRIVPADHQGVIVRVHDATGTLFDQSFMGFPVAEQRRLSQITCEIFVTEGFDGALNIDRESFNFAHPHVVSLTRWLHRALRTLIAAQKRISAEVLAEKRSELTSKNRSEVEKVIDEVWAAQTEHDGSSAPEVVFSEGGRKPEQADRLEFPRSILGSFQGKNAREREVRVANLMAGIVQTLAAYDRLSDLSTSDQHELLSALRRLIESAGAMPK